MDDVLTSNNSKFGEFIDCDCVYSNVLKIKENIDKDK